MIEGKPTWLKPSELAAMGFSQVVYPNFVMMRTIRATQDALEQLGDLARHDAAPRPMEDFEGARALFREAVREAEWSAYEPGPRRTRARG